ncbi:dihydroorotate dehydrogenase electron transfer subunit [Actinomadura kijaniata]|uniref:Dihydroorotate dehydrogenase electron transfer subunit n=1 Tax=Actinomadura namibiensis TaxID=182080 RepID=A0A7W3LSM6_ACTNM|nr:dihydroorotate dehydrogenase electron transfer subunit [Actinomadura namibiensis]MBA8953555.1 dihydroorotate dehydrogenase electron transfer subunit [Actinomadura namibiensis]
MSDTPVQTSATVLTVRQVQDYHAITLVAPAIAERFRPGQFVALAVGGAHSGRLVRRCFGVYEVKSDYGGTVELVFADTEPGTAWLAGLRSRDQVDVVGPLGRPFRLPRDPVGCLLVGGGPGGAALFALADTLRRRGCPVHFLLGGPAARQVFGSRMANRIGDSATVVTGDGSMGERGAVPEVMPRVVAETGADVVYACGPTSLLRSVTRIATEHGLPSQVSVEEFLQRTGACGIGTCMTCVLPVHGEDGVTRMVRACADGPVLRGDRVRWGDLGTIPFDALGAPRVLSAMEGGSS